MERFIIAAVLFNLLSFAHAEDVLSPAADDASVTVDEDMQQPRKITPKKPMKMDEPMPTEMAKEGMMKSDVKAGAAQKEIEMEKMMHQEDVEE